MAENRSMRTDRSSPGLLGLLGLIFIVLKLIGAIDWSWWLVLLPIWGPIALGLVLILIFSIAAALADVITR